MRSSVPATDLIDIDSACVALVKSDSHSLMVINMNLEMHNNCLEKITFIFKIETV